MSTYIRMNQTQMISTLVLLQEKIDERCGNTISLEKTIEFLDTTMRAVDFNHTDELNQHIDEFLDNIGMER